MEKVPLSKINQRVVLSGLLALTIGAIGCMGSATAASSRFTAALVHSDRQATGSYDDAMTAILNADREAQRRFALLAIEAMVDSYEEELTFARETPMDQKHDVASWQVGTRRFIDHLVEIHRNLSRGETVDLVREQHGELRIITDSAQLMVSAARVGGQAKLEQKIASLACRSANCSNFDETVEERTQRRNADSRSQWVFTENAAPRFASTDGLECIFDDHRHLNLKRSACLNLVHELRLLAETLLSLKLHGKIIDWRHLTILQVGPGQPHKLLYAAGHFVRVKLPSLMRAQKVWQEAIPWIRAGLAGRTTQHVIQLPDDLVYLTSVRERENVYQ